MIFFDEIKRTLTLAFPMILGQLGAMSMHWIDAAMVGRGVGTIELAALAFSGSVAHVFLIMGFGLITTISVLTANAYGARRQEGLSEVMETGWLVCFVYSATMALLMTLVIDPFASFAVHWLDQPALVVEAARPYLVLYFWAFVPILAFSALRAFSEAQDRPWLPFLVLVVGLAINAGLNALLIFGLGGFPRMGVAGAGLATLLAQSFMLVTMAVVVLRSGRFPIDASILRLRRISGPFLRKFLSLGIPSSLQIFFEVAAFSAASILMGRFGAIPLAAHHICIQFAAMTFMVPLGLSFAASIRIGQAAGVGDVARIRRIGFSSQLFGFGIMLGFGLLYLLLRQGLPPVFTDDPAVSSLAASLLLIVAFFQVFDGLQVMSAGSLRGLQDVRVPTFLLLFCYWVVALPAGAILGFSLGLGPSGIWLGIALGLGLAALGLTMRFAIVSKRPPRGHEPEGASGQQILAPQQVGVRPEPMPTRSS